MTEHDDPKSPEVRCGVEGFAHRACVTKWSVWLACYECYCPDCRANDEGIDGLATSWEGTGKTTLEAAEYYADQFGGIDELTIKEPHV